MKSKKKLIIASSCLAGLVLIVALAFTFWYATKATPASNDALPDETVVATVNKDEIKVSQIRYFQIIKLANLTEISDNNSETLKDDVVLQDIIERLSVYLEINREQNDNFFLVYKDIHYSDSDVKNACDNAVKRFKENWSKQDFPELYEYTELLKLDSEAKKMNDLMKLQMIYQKFRDEYFKYYRKQSFSDAELENRFYKHILDIRGKNAIKIK